MKIFQNSYSGQVARERFYKRMCVVAEVVFVVLACAGFTAILVGIAFVTSN